MLYPIQNDRRNKLDLSGIWDFKTDASEAGERDGWFNGLEGARPIAVPGSWNEQYEDIYNYTDLAWYVRRTFVPTSWRDQQVFIRVWRSAARYEASAKFTTWLFTITKNLVFNEIRRRNRDERIADFEKIRLVRERVARAADAKGKELVGELDRYLAAVGAEREFAEAHMRETLAQATRALAASSERLEH